MPNTNQGSSRRSSTGEVIAIRPGERVTLGIIKEGSSSFDLSAVTGESAPEFREAGGESLVVP